MCHYESLDVFNADISVGYGFTGPWSCVFAEEEGPCIAVQGAAQQYVLDEISSRPHE